MEPLGVHSCGEKTDHCASIEGFLVGFLDELPDHSPVWRIHKGHRTTPFLPIDGERVLLGGYEVRVLGIEERGTGIQCEVKLFVEFVIQVLRSPPVTSLAQEVDLRVFGRSIISFSHSISNSSQSIRGTLERSIAPIKPWVPVLAPRLASSWSLLPL